MKEIVEISNSEDETKCTIEYDLSNDSAVIKKYNSDDEVVNTMELDCFEVEALSNKFMENTEAIVIQKIKWEK